MQENIKLFILNKLNNESENNIFKTKCITFLVEGEAGAGKTYFIENNFLKDDFFKENNYEIFKFNCFNVQESFLKKVIKTMIEENPSPFCKNYIYSTKWYKFFEIFWKLLIIPLIFGILLPFILKLDLKWTISGPCILIATFFSLIFIWLTCFHLQMNSLTDLKKMLDKKRKYIYIFDDLDRVGDLEKRDYILKEINLLKLFLQKNNIGQENIFIIISNKVNIELLGKNLDTKLSLSNSTPWLKKTTEKIVNFSIGEIRKLEKQKFLWKNKSFKIDEKFYDFKLIFFETEFQKKETLKKLFKEKIKNQTSLNTFINLIEKSFVVLKNKYNLRKIERMINIINELENYSNNNKWFTKRYIDENSILGKIFSFALIFSCYEDTFWAILQKDMNEYNNYIRIEIKTADPYGHTHRNIWNPDLKPSEIFVLYQTITCNAKEEGNYYISINELKKQAEKFKTNHIYAPEIFNTCDSELLAKDAFTPYLMSLINSFQIKPLIKINQLFEIKFINWRIKLLLETIFKSQNFINKLENQSDILDLNINDFNNESFINQIILLKMILLNREGIARILLSLSPDENDPYLSITNNIDEFQDTKLFLQDKTYIKKDSMFVTKIKGKYKLLENENYLEHNYQFLVDYFKNLITGNKLNLKEIANILVFLFYDENWSENMQIKNNSYLVLIVNILQEINNEKLNKEIFSNSKIKSLNDNGISLNHLNIEEKEWLINQAKWWRTEKAKFK